MRETMARLESRLDPKRFIRIHRSTIVNFDRLRLHAEVEINLHRKHEPKERPAGDRGSASDPWVVHDEGVHPPLIGTIEAVKTSGATKR